MEPDAILDENDVPIDAIYVELEGGPMQESEEETYFSDWSDEKAREKHVEILNKLIDIEEYSENHLQQGSKVARRLLDQINYSPEDY